MDKHAPFLRTKQIQFQGLESVEASQVCDHCDRGLREGEHEPVVVEWRTPERLVKQSISPWSALTILGGAAVVNKEFAWDEKCGVYFLCKGCRNRLVPRLRAASLRTILVAVSAFVLVSLLAAFLGLEKLAFDEGGAAWAFFCAGVLTQILGTRSRYRGYPTDSGYRVQTTSFGTPTSVLGSVLQFGCLTVAAPTLFLIISLVFAIPFALFQAFWGSGLQDVSGQIAAVVAPNRVNAEKGMTQWLTKLGENSSEDPVEIGQAFLDNYKPKQSGRYKNQSELMQDYQHLEKLLVDKKPTQLMKHLLRESPASRLARYHEGKAGPDYASEEKFLKILRRVSEGQIKSEEDVGRIILASWQAMKGNPKRPDLLKFFIQVEKKLSNKVSLEEAVQKISQ